MNIIGLAQTSREILKGVVIPISPYVVITPKALRNKLSQLRSHYPHFEQRLIKPLYEHTLNDSVRHPPMLIGIGQRFGWEIYFPLLSELNRF